MSAARRSSLASRFFLHRAEIGVVAGLVPGGSDGFRDQRRLDVVDGAAAPGHAADHAGQHGEALLAVVAVMRRRPGVDHGEGVEAGRVLAEGDERAFQRFGGVLERAPVVDHHGLAAGADQPGHQLLHQHRLARAGLAGDGDVVVAGLVGEGRPAGRLAPAADQEEGRGIVGVGGLAPPLAVQRREVDRARRQQGLHPAHAFEIGVETAGRGHRQTGQPGGELHVALRVHPPALAVVDRAHRLLGLVERVQRGVDGGHVAGPDQLLAVLDPVGHRLPVARLLGQAGEILGDAGARLLGGAGGFQERLLARRLVAGGDGEAGEHRAARLQEVAVEVADQGVAAPARPDLGEGDGGEHANCDVVAVGVVEGEAGGMDRERPAGRDALFVQRIARRPAPRRAFGPAVAVSADIRRHQLGCEREKSIRLHPAGLRPGGRQRAFQCPAERAERGLRGRAGARRTRRSAREAGGDEHPVVGERERRSPAVQPPPAAGRQQVAATLAHPCERPAGLAARFGPGPARRPEARTRPMDDLDRAALGRGVGQRACQRAQGLGVDAGEGWQLDHKSGARGVDVELARFVEGAPGQQGVQRGRHRRRRPGTRRFGPLEEFEEAADHFSLQPAGSSTTRM